jgi:hypothetical protein
MVGPLGAQDGPLRYLTTPLVTKTIGDGVVGYREAVRGTAAGKSLARMQIIVALSGASLTNCPDLPITSRRAFVQRVPPRPVLAAHVSGVVR